MYAGELSDDPVAGWDEEIVHLVASGIARLTERVRATGAVRVPYPAALQRGLDRLTVLCWARRTHPPGGVAELLRLAHQPFRDWPVRLRDELVDEYGALLSLGIPTRLCDEWALATEDVEAELDERQVVLEVMDWCRQMGNRRAYVEFRRLLIEHPVLEGPELHDAQARPDLAGLAPYIRRAYERAPAHLAAEGEFQTCGRCGNLSVPSRDCWWCVEDDCGRLRYRAGRQLGVAADVWTVGRGIRTFVTSPGRAELRLLRWLDNHHYAPEPYPEFDASDLRIPVPGRPDRWWAVDVKSWHNPALLARRLRRRPPRIPPWADRFFIVIDRERTRNRPGYVQLVASLAPTLAEAGVIVRTEKTFLREDLPTLTTKGTR